MIPSSQNKNNNTNGDDAAAPLNKGLGNFLSSRRSGRKFKKSSDSSSFLSGSGHGTLATESITEATTNSTVYLPYDLPDKAADPFNYFSQQRLADENGNIHLEAPVAPILEKNVEGVWFGSISDRFQRFCMDRYVNNANSSLENIALPRSGGEGEGDTAAELSGDSTCCSSDSMGLSMDESVDENIDFNTEVSQDKEEPQKQEEEKEAHKVQFNTIDIEYHEDEHDWTFEEVESYHYEKETLDMFRDNTAIAAQVLLANSSGTGPNSRLDCFTQAYKKCCKDIQKEAKDAVTWKRIDKFLSKLVACYELEPNTLVGLEHYILTAVRGDPKSLRHFVLQQAQSWNSRSSKSRRSILDDQEKILAHISQCVSQPSQLLAHAVAVALAETMLSDVVLAATLVEGMKKSL